MTDQGLSIFDEQSGKGSPDDKTQVIPVASRGGQEAPQAPAGGSGGVSGFQVSSQRILMSLSFGMFLPWL